MICSLFPHFIFCHFLLPYFTPVMLVLTIPWAPREASLTGTLHLPFPQLGHASPSYMQGLCWDMIPYKGFTWLFHRLVPLPSLSITLTCIAFLLCSYHYSTNHIFICLCFVFFARMQTLSEQECHLFGYCFTLSASHTTAEIIHPCFTG